MQTVTPDSRYISLYEGAKLVYAERNGSIKKIYYGVSVNCTRALLSWGIINVSYEILHTLLYDSNLAFSTVPMSTREGNEKAR